MPTFRIDSLERLRERIDLVEVLNPHLDLKPSGSAYKALCPFHDEKTPSFVIQKGDSHYHCFGCGAHGDAIQFLMNYLNMTFVEAVQSLAERFQVVLEQVEDKEEKGPNKAKLKEALELANRFYQFMLLHTEEGHKALHYLYRRGIDLDFIRKFQIGLAPAYGFLHKWMHEKRISNEILIEVGLLTTSQSGKMREFFIDRITFPIQQATGGVIGFSARKFKEETFGGKYINTKETPLFKKSKILFGLNHCRRRVAKERKAIIAEGQIDTLRLIQSGFDYAVAAQGTAFGEGHAKELIGLGVLHVYLSLDPDKAGQEAAYKIGDLFQKEGVAVTVIQLPEGYDPDLFLREKGSQAFQRLLDESEDYLSFLVNFHGKTLNTNTPAGKNELVRRLSKQIRAWDNPLMMHESLKKLAELTELPEEMLGIGQTEVPNIYIKKSGSIVAYDIDPDKVLEQDLLRWLIVMNGSYPQCLRFVKEHLVPEQLKTPEYRELYQIFLTHESEGKPFDLLSLAMSLEDQDFLSEILQKKIHMEKAEEHLSETVQKLMDRNWMMEREMIKMKIQSGKCTDEEVMELIKQFDGLKSNPPKVGSLCLKSDT